MTERMPKPGHTTRFSTVPEVAKLFRVSKMTIYRMIEQEELPHVRIGRSIRIPTAGVWKYLDEQQSMRWNKEKPTEESTLPESLPEQYYTQNHIRAV